MMEMRAVQERCKAKAAAVPALASVGGDLEFAVRCAQGGQSDKAQERGVSSEGPPLRVL